ncbi:ATP-binding protein [Streptomyces sp. NPDC050738]|uniref:ATP-binding protein n=1 Tax=Streptomyces sp. NPDC050738 TaxID=3154744 RepID=UPI0034480546
MTGYENTEPQLRCVLPFEASPAEMRLLRRAVAAQFMQWGVAAAVDEAQLAVTELATNVIKHVGGGAAATLIMTLHGGRIRLEMHDKSHVVPSPAPVGVHEEECGRGLHLLVHLAADWGTLLTATGKVVWCELDGAPGDFSRNVERAATVLEGYQGRSEPGARAGGPHSAGLRLTESAVELITDLLHWTAARGDDPDDILDRAQMHYEAVSEVA